MALIKQRIPISFTQGVDTKSDPKQVLPGRLLTLENGVFTSPGMIQKRNGLSSRTTRVDGRDRFSSGSALAAFKDEQLLFTGAEVHSWVPALEKWSFKGQASSVITRTDRLVSNGYAQSNMDVAALNGVELYAWEDSRGGVRCSTVDSTLRTRLAEDLLVSATGTRPTCVATSGELRVYFVDGDSLKYRSVATSTPSTLATEVVAVTDVSTITGSVGPVSTFTDESENVWTAFLSGSALAVSVHTYALTEIMPPTIVDANPGTVRNVTGFVASGSQANVYYEVTGSSSIDQLVKVVSVNASGSAIGTPTVWKRSVGLASEAWQHGPSWYLNCVHDSPLQATYFTFNSDGTAVSKSNPSIAGGLRASGSLSNVAAVGPGVYRFANAQKGRVESEGNTLFANPGLSSTELDFTSGNRYFSAPLADCLHVVGGTLGCYDGSTYAEHNFHVYPESVSGSTSTSHGSMEAGTRDYLATYEWDDAGGQRHRSATSVPVTVTTTGPTGSVTLTAPSLRLTNKANVEVCFYRTEALGDTFYRVTSPTHPTYNSGSADSVTYVDTLSDASLISREAVYTTGGTLDDFPAPPCDLTITCGGRVWVGGLEDGFTLAYSKLAVVGSPVGFNPALTLKVEQFGGRVTALGVIDSALIVFKRSCVYSVVGSGPNNLGAQGDFSVSRVTTDVGCRNPNSVVVTPDGLMFQSDKGIYLLDRAGSVSYVGALVAAYNRLTVTSATLVATRNQVRFTTDSSVTLAYDYAAKQWSTFTGGYASAVDSDVWGDRFVLLRANGSVAEETPGSFADDGGHVKLRLVTGHLSLAGLEGFQRVYKLIVLGDYKGPHRLLVQLGYDYNASFADSATIDAEAVMGLTPYGADSPYGEGSPYGGEFPRYEFDVRPSRQKCTAIRVSIEDQQSSAYNEGLSLSALTVEYGVKNGANKLGSRRRFSAR